MCVLEGVHTCALRACAEWHLDPRYALAFMKGGRCRSRARRLQLASAPLMEIAGAILLLAPAAVNANGGGNQQGSATSTSNGDDGRACGGARRGAFAHCHWPLGGR